MKKKNRNPVLSLLQKLNSTQIEDLIMGQKLAMKEYQFYYALDSHDVHKYCFPGNLRGTDFERDESGEIIFELESDKITAYEEFFSTIGKGHHCFFLDEYISEFIGLRDQIIKNINAAKFFNYTDSFNVFLSGYVASRQGLLEDFTLFISIATGLLRNGAQRFNGLLQNPYFCVRPEELQDLDIPHKDLILSAFKHSLDASQELTAIVRNAFGEYNASRHSKGIDSEAIARMIRINQFLIREFPDEKVLFLFLSSAETTRPVFQSILEQLPVVAGERFNFHRTVEQLFIGRLLGDLKPEEQLARLRAIKELILYREQTQQIDVADEQYQELEERVLGTLQELRENYVNANLARMDQFEATEALNVQLMDRFGEKYGNQPYDADLDDDPERQQGRKEGSMPVVRTSNLKKLFNDLKKTAERFPSEKENVDYIRQLENAFLIREIFSLIFKKAIYELLQHNQPMRISRGKDPIKGAGQHMPVVFTCSEMPYGRNLDDIAELYLDQFAFISKHSAREDIISRLQQMASTIYDGAFDAKSPAEKLVFCLYLLILPDTNVKPGKTNNDWVKDFLLNIFKRGLEGEDGEIYSDYLYALSWVLRRNGDYKEARYYTDLGIDKFPDDARFYHSRFLVNVCLYKDEYDLHRRDIEKAQEKYGPMLKTKSDVIRRNIEAALLNSEIYSAAQIIAAEESTGEEKRAAFDKLSSEKLEALKSCVAPNYEEYPEFLHTEAFLELHACDNEPDPGKKEKKLERAVTALKIGSAQARKLMGFDLDIFRHLEQELQKMKTKISAGI